MRGNAFGPLPACLFLTAATLASPPGFAPPLDQKLSYVRTEERSDPSGKVLFRIERSLIFARRNNGWTVTIRPIAEQAPTGGRAAGLIAAGLSGLKGKTVIMALDAHGSVTGIEDEDTVWGAFLSGITALVARAPTPKVGQPAQPQQIDGTLKSLPRANRFSLLKSLLPPIVAPGVGDAEIGTTRPVTMSAVAPSGAPTKLTGDERYQSAGDGLLIIETRVQGDIPASGAVPAAHIVAERVQRIDRRSGLIVESRERRETTIGNGRSAARSVTVTMGKLRLVS